MSDDLVARARNRDETAFAELTGPFQRELHVHCYRMLGSLQDAEDALQETLLSAWQSLPGFEGRASIRTWLYQVATHRCLNLLRSARRRPQTDWPPPGVVPPEPTSRGEVTWLEPYPDVMLAGLADAAQGPEARYEGSEAISLAFMTTVQLLPPRQRAVLILRDVLGFPARDVAEMLGSSEGSVTMALTRARTALRSRHPAGLIEPALPGSAAEMKVVGALTRAYEAADVDQLVALLTDDVLLAMPPLPLQYEGIEATAGFLNAVVFRPGCKYRMVPVRANGQPGLAVYQRGELAITGNGVLVFTLAGDRVAAITRFDASVLPWFALPAELAE